ncbi:MULTISPECIES: hypothetical protein [Pasteurellaceae]|uniref:Uncharacterized protein n=3 Tax=Pasteurellaceae TaxID=712 RepID=A0A4R2NBF8_9PAST|nr:MULTISPECIES: hypothetical protein [Pasteurellaceae]MDH2924837.1 hypothetical protein [Nicoletella semolina]MDK9430413.1 hypothetical protein [Gallibacterium anatis]MEE3608219.1 hypothetical protein [Avibacterium paragallinarum]MEE3621710.1 hypothetical protein [Avibacterium paragallinarum]MEE3668368.1 hypothetical protein [Avibacterium paragallinarum]
MKQSNSIDINLLFDTLLAVSELSLKLNFLLKNAQDPIKITKIINVMSNLTLISSAYTENGIDIDSLALFRSMINDLDYPELNRLNHIINKAIVAHKD